jgi:hydroxymethylbilane synthase
MPRMVKAAAKGLVPGNNNCSNGPVASARHYSQMDKIRLGTRGSPLALAQAREVKQRLEAAHGFSPDRIEIIAISTTGDRVKDRPLAEIGGKGLFTKEIEEALLSGAIDLAVHSMKDMPAQTPAGLMFPAVLPREDARDAFISVKYPKFSELPQFTTLGSSSVRRTAQALRLRPDLKFVGFRGNVETRLRKLGEGVADATFLACAGLNRLGLSAHVTEIMSTDDMLPAAAQGIVVIETADTNKAARDLVMAINDLTTMAAAACERAFLAGLDGSCQTPIAGHAKVAGATISFRGQALTLDGMQVFEHANSGSLADAAAMGHEAAAQVKQRGGSKLLLT